VRAAERGGRREGREERGEGGADIVWFVINREGISGAISSTQDSTRVTSIGDIEIIAVLERHTGCAPCGYSERGGGPRP
jgi:hypothetical protein